MQVFTYSAVNAFTAAVLHGWGSPRARTHFSSGRRKTRSAAAPALRGFLGNHCFVAVGLVAADVQHHPDAEQDEAQAHQPEQHEHGPVQPAQSAYLLL